ncbi:MAG: NAD-dependent epimerase/dehydratase family protein [Spirochaetia bacterium]|nr:NAD-dependent epimerase/dehydratase family protein [Spirochaetia bacterium]
MRIAVTGGTGFIGSHVVDLLLSQGFEVQCLVLPGEDRLWLKGLPLRFFEGDLTDRESLVPFLRNCNAIINAAGLTRAKSEEEFFKINKEGPVNLVEAALSLEDGPRHILCMSTQAVMGPCAEGCCSVEGDPLNPITPYGRSKAAMEQALLDYELRGLLHCTFFRAPGVYGPRDRDFLKYFRLINKGLRVVTGDSHITSLLYVKSLAAAIVSCVLNPKAFGQAFFVADARPYDWDEFSAMIEKALGKKTFRIYIPNAVIGIISVCSETLKPFLKKPPLIDKNKILEMRQQRWVVSTAKAQSLIGFSPLENTEEAISKTARWYCAQGWLRADSLSEFKEIEV